MPFLGMARGTLSGGIWRNKTQEAPREDNALQHSMHVVSVIDVDVCIVTLIFFTSMWFVHNISLCLSLTTLLIITNSTRNASPSLSKAPRTCLDPKSHFNTQDEISSVLIPNADTEIPKIQPGL